MTLLPPWSVVAVKQIERAVAVVRGRIGRPGGGAGAATFDHLHEPA
ncbi:MAG: hypothetical protein H0X37_18640 [Herpetosiphonaceae bacterium]|nr:hypothetical protein [Herpetosiphonaceae bacterium]